MGSSESPNGSSPEDERLPTDPQAFLFSRTEHPYMLQSSIAERLSVQPDCELFYLRSHVSLFGVLSNLLKIRILEVTVPLIDLV